jgi:glycosyltransferase involved in cell wall biosynthesis
MLELQHALPRHELLALARTAHIGVALMPKDPDDLNLQYLLGASNKLFDYMACGLAVLVSDLPDWQRMCVEPGYGLACNPDDPVSIAAALRWFVEHPEDTRAMGERGRQRILSEWNYETQFAAAVQLINAAALTQ